MINALERQPAEKCMQGKLIQSLATLDGKFTLLQRLGQILKQFYLRGTGEEKCVQQRGEQLRQRSAKVDEFQASLREHNSLIFLADYRW
eukprot:m.85867 g.85867  ORF g.85867 m.85867 type:complete len:89 (+) comp36483_c0_seq5:466-732(+)